jgi:hypothetical protein
MENQENKISKEQLEELQGYVGKLNNAASQIGNLELQKHQLQHSAAEVQTDLNKMQAKLEEKYGKIKIDIQTGAYEAIEEDESGEEIVGPEVLKKT